MKNILRKISWLILSVVAMITAFIYFCPMMAYDNSASNGFLPNLCQSSEYTDSNTENTANCFSAHLTIAGHFIGNIPNYVNLILALILPIVIYPLFSKNIQIIIQPAIIRLKRCYFYYHTSVKRQIEKKLLEYLNLLKNSTSVSFS